jgi:hypothetical protein
MHQFWPFVLDQLSHIVGDLWEALSCSMMWSEIIRGA